MKTLIVMVVETDDRMTNIQRLGVKVEQEDIQKTVSILQVAAKEEGVARIIEKTWIQRFQCQA